MIQHDPPFNCSRKEKLHSVLRWDYLLMCNCSPQQDFIDKILYDKGDYVKMNEHLNKINWKLELELLNPNQQYERLLAEYELVTKLFIPCIKILITSDMRHKPKWLNKEIRTETRKKARLWKKRLASPDSGQLKIDYQIVSRSIKKLVDKAVKNYELSIITKAKSNPKLLYDYINTQNKIKDSIRSLKSSDDSTITNELDIANCLNDTFFNVFIKHNNYNDYPSLPSKPLSKEFKLDEYAFSVSNILTEIQKLDSTKSIGPDGVRLRVLKECAPVFAHILSIIFTKSYSTGIVPDKWKVANLSPIHKSGPKNISSNYRPISLTSVPCKIMERILKKEMMSHLVNNNLISEQQHGFVQFKSCVTNLLVTVDYLSETLNRGFSAIMIYLDFAKAFDKVDHNAVLYKLPSFGFPNLIINWVQNFLSNRKQRVIVGSVYSSLIL